MDLQTTFYIIGIVFMSLMLLIMIGVVIAIFAIRAKVIALERTVNEKISTVTNIAHIVTDLISALKRIATNS